MAPLTRFRADDSHVQLPMVAEYHAQRASVAGTLIISEATFISKDSGGYPNVPGIWNREQIDAWKKVTDAVHAKGSFIFCQLWALGRVAVPDVAAAEGFDIVSSSPSALEPGAPVPREATKAAIQGFIRDYAQAAKNAIAAGFDGVEVHGAGGYLIDQFRQDNCNQRTDEYGGSIENRTRFIHEVVRVVTHAVGVGRVGSLKSLKLYYLHLIEARVCGNVDSDHTDSLDFAIRAWDDISPIILAGGYTPASAKRVVDEQFEDKNIMVAFGRYFISHPDLPFKIRRELELTPYNRDTFYSPKLVADYLDYSFSQEFQAQA
ncbi:hypothetical protein QQX98_006696 [Neonectria punicea]|uniref:NADH:flavin oxidoreductase/NADH oxidase N-terminal domain-containing protein n=1 Tax=Neonectria punicea TaxID=979145 RepID=A0ABR1H011_9HYPO